jgi:tetratricopeptide (TPR) repeat protein
VSLWAAWCAPCLDELADLAARRADLEAAGLSLLALDVEGPQTARESSALLDRLGWPFARGRSTPELHAILDVVQRALLEHRRDLPLPTSFLLDARGRLRVLYKGPLDVGALLADAGRLEASPEALRDGAAPFPGRWHAPPFRRDLAQLEARLQEAGLERAARELALERVAVLRRSPAEMQLEFGNARARQNDLEGAVEHFQRATELEPRLRQAWTSLGAARHQLGRVEEAADAYEAALLRDPKHPDTLFNLALAYAYLGEQESAHQLAELLDALDATLASDLRRQSEALHRR